MTLIMFFRWLSAFSQKFVLVFFYMSTYKTGQNWRIELGCCLKAFAEVEHMAAVLRCHILLNFHISFVFPIIFYGLNLCHISPFISLKNLPLSHAAWSLDHSVLHWPSFEVALRNVWVGKKKNLFCMIAYHFLVLVLRVWRWLYSLKSSLFCLFFFSQHAGKRSQQGHVCGLNSASPWLLIIVSFCTSSA